MDQQIVEAMRDRELAIGGFAHRFDFVFINGAGDHACAVALQQIAHLGEFFFAIFQIDGIHDAFARCGLEARFDHIELGGIDHQRRFDIFGETLDDFDHVANAIAANVIDADIHDVRPLLHLLAADGGTGINVFGDDGFFEFFRAVGVGALADDEDGEILTGGFGGVERGDLRRGGGRLAAEGAAV